MSDHQQPVGVKCFPCGADFGLVDYSDRRQYARIRGRFVLCTAWRNGEGLCKEYPLSYYKAVSHA